MKSSKRKVIHWWGKGGDKIHEDEKVSKKTTWSKKSCEPLLCVDSEQAFIL